MSPRLILELVLVIVVAALALQLWRTRKVHQFSRFKNATEALFHLTAAIALTLSGAWVLAQRDWAPKTTVDVRPVATLLEEAPARLALMQIAVSMKNEGRIPQTYTEIRTAVRGYTPGAAKPDPSGDLANRPLGEFNNPHFYDVRPGETDVAYSEFKISCSERVVQVLVKVTKPGMPWGGSEPLKYERKVDVPLTPVCSTDDRNSR